MHADRLIDAVDQRHAVAIKYAGNDFGECDGCRLGGWGVRGGSTHDNKYGL
jgi:hypothetical protein